MSLAVWKDWAYGGVNESLEGNGGPECAAFLEPGQRLLETLFMCVVTGAEIYWGWNMVCASGATSKPLPPTERVDRKGKRFLLVLVCMTFGIEVGFKFATKQLIYLLNPCHVATIIQIYLLASPPSISVMIVFRLHMHMLNGALLAIVFPVTNTRLLPFESEIYWIQHGLLLVVPFYLMRLGGPYTTEPLTDLSWVLLAMGLDFAYHFLPLQALALLTQVNLNNMLCPAVSDPFYGRWYRLCAILHQRAMLLVQGKLYTFLAQLILPYTSHTYLKQLSLVREACGESEGDDDLYQTPPPPTASITCPHCGGGIEENMNGLTGYRNMNGYAKKDE